MKLTREFYQKNGIEVAKNLLGKVLVHKTKEGTTKGIIVETESYMGKIDKAAHSYKKGSYERTKIQYEQGGYAYVYMIYGMYYCMNVTANKENLPEAVLIRALEPLENIELMQKRRKTNNIKNLCSGPGKLASAMGITKEQYGLDLLGDELYIEDYNKTEFEIEATKRINIDYAEEAKDFLWRFIIKGNPYVSKTKKSNS